MIQEDFFVYSWSKSFLHRLHSLIKIFVTIILSLVVFNSPSVIALIILAMTLFLALFAGMKLTSILRGSFFIVAITVFFSLFMVIDISPTPFIISFKISALHDVGVNLLRIFTVFVLNSLFYAVTAISEVRRSLRAFNLPFFTSIALLLSLFLSFIPLSVALWHEAVTAWTARGGKKGIKMLLTILPLYLERMLKHALTKADAITARGFFTNIF